MRLETVPYPPRPARPPFGVTDGMAVSAVLLIAAARFYPFDRYPLVTCGFKAVTGLPCLTCGMTRSWVHLAHLDAGAAFAQSPLGASLCGAAALLAASVALRHALRLPMPRAALTPRQSWLAAAAGLAALALNWLYTWSAGVG